MAEVSLCPSPPKDKCTVGNCECSGLWRHGTVDALVDTGRCSLPNINSVYGNRILLFNRAIEVRAGAISHGDDASAGGRRERWRTTAISSRLCANRYIFRNARQNASASFFFTTKQFVIFIYIKSLITHKFAVYFFLLVHPVFYILFVWQQCY